MVNYMVPGYALISQHHLCNGCCYANVILVMHDFGRVYS